VFQAAAQHGITALALKTDPGAAGSLVALADRIEIWPIDRLRPYERNPRTHSDAQVDQIAASMVEFGRTNPILIDENAGILAGHGRLLAAHKLGLTGRPRLAGRPSGRPGLLALAPGRPGLRPRGVRDLRHEAVYLFGAVCPARDAGVALVLPTVSASAMQAMLDELSQAVSPGAHAVVLMDRAGWQIAKDLAIPANLTPLFLPPYAPVLNPIERVWLYLRERFLSHRLWRRSRRVLRRLERPTRRRRPHPFPLRSRLGRTGQFLMGAVWLSVRGRGAGSRRTVSAGCACRENDRREKHSSRHT
jgi:putative transposase